MRLLMTRPDLGGEPDPLSEALAAAGHHITQAPLLAISLTGPMPPIDGVQALIVTSRNGLRAVAPVSGRALDLPLFAVGPGTGELARALGFRRIVEGPGTGRELAEIIRAEATPAAGALMHIASDTLAFDMKGALAPLGFEIRTEVVYRTETATAFPPVVVDRLRQGGFDGVVLMSPRTARVYAKLVGDAALASMIGGLRHFCLSDAVARELAPLGVADAAVARLPNSQEMLALIARETPDLD